VFAEGLRQAPEGSWFRHNFDLAISLMDKYDRNHHALWMELHQVLRGEYKSSVPEAVVAAFTIYLLTDGNFRDCTVYACNFGRDSDTIGAIAGALAGATGGIDVIPVDWVERVRQPNGTCLQFTAKRDIVEVALKLTRLRELDSHNEKLDLVAASKD
jgi:ADP-ribosylglycohydrolase